VECLDRVPDLDINLGNYAVRDTFYMVDLSDTCGIGSPVVDHIGKNHY
jgi:hypothetical protein